MKPSHGKQLWAGLLAACCLFVSWTAQATAPRIAPQLFGEELKADIVAYPMQAKDVDGELLKELVVAAFKAADKAPLLDVLPSRQLAKYALLNNDAAALIGNQDDLSTKEKNQYRLVNFYWNINVPEQVPLALIFGKKHIRSKELQKAFEAGLQKLIQNGKYAEIVEAHLGSGKLPADYFERLKRRK